MPRQKSQQGYNFLDTDEMVNVLIKPPLNLCFRDAYSMAVSDKTLVPLLGYCISTPEDYRAYCIEMYEKGQASE